MITIPFSTYAKKIIAYIFYYTGISFIAFKINIRYNKLRVINYHSTPRYYNENFENQISFLRKYFKNVNIENLYTTPKIISSEPSLIITFDDGLRSNYDNAVPILEKYNFKGLFFICPHFLINSQKKKLIKDIQNMLKLYYFYYQMQLYLD